MGLGDNPSESFYSRNVCRGKGCGKKNHGEIEYNTEYNREAEDIPNI